MAARHGQHQTARTRRDLPPLHCGLVVFSPLQVLSSAQYLTISFLLLLGNDLGLVGSLGFSGMHCLYICPYIPVNPIPVCTVCIFAHIYRYNDTGIHCLYICPYGSNSPKGKFTAFKCEILPLKMRLNRRQKCNLKSVKCYYSPTS